MEGVFVHPTAEVHPEAHVGEGTKIWNWAQVREGAAIGRDCTIGRGVYIDAGVHVGDWGKIENNVSVFRGVTIGARVFIGPHVCFTNDKYPRACNIEGTPKGESDWEVLETYVGVGASIGAGSVILPGIVIGDMAVVAAGSVVTHSVPPGALVVGNPARVREPVCSCGRPMSKHRTCK